MIDLRVQAFPLNLFFMRIQDVFWSCLWAISFGFIHKSWYMWGSSNMTKPSGSWRSTTNFEDVNWKSNKRTKARAFSSEWKTASLWFQSNWLKIRSSSSVISPARKISKAVSEWQASMTWSYSICSFPAVVSTTFCFWPSSILIVLRATTDVERCNCSAGSPDKILLK